MTELKIFVIFLFFKLSLSQSVSNRTANTNRYVKEEAIFSSPHKSVDNAESSVDCAMFCNINPDCCGYTFEQSDINCFLFYYQTSNNCQNTTDGSTQLHFVKQLTDCSDLAPENPSGVHRVYLSRQTAVLVYCEMTDAGGGWTVLQRRQDGSEDFYRYWADYKRGFGDMQNEFWIGNDIIHNITSQKQYKVRFDLEGFDGLTAYAEYSSFYVDDEAMNYGMTISGYSGTAGTGHEFDYSLNGVVQFSTRDADHDKLPYRCASDLKKGGWWYVRCSASNINGKYQQGVNSHRTMHWGPWRGYQCLRKTRMMIKPA